MGSDRREDPSTRDRITEMQRGYQSVREGYEHWRRATITILTVVCIFLLAVGAVNVILLVRTSHLAKESNARASDAKQLAQEIQASRIDLTRQSCLDLNARNDNTNNALSKLEKKSMKGQSQTRRMQIRQSVATTKLLINALVPKQDCDALVKQRYGKQNP